MEADLLLEGVLAAALRVVSFLVERILGRDEAVDGVADQAVLVAEVAAGD